ncbi:hypothetical protein DL89DRAFT_264191, partial [Linderina pennispora]
MSHCKRCKQTVDIDSIIGTLPDAKLLQVQGALNTTTAPTDISRYLSQQFRADQIKRHANGTARQPPEDEESQTSSQADSCIPIQPPAPLHAEQNDMAKTFGVIGRIMDKLDARSMVDHPMCEDCAETMLRLLDREGILDSQLEGLAGQLADLDAESLRLDQLEARTFQEQNEHQQVLERSGREQWALDDRYKKLSAQLMQLQRTNVYNDIFNISVVDNIANINGFRLGGRGSVEWDRDQCCTVARKLNYEFLDYRLIPMGGFSRIERLTDGAAFELFGTGDQYFGRLFQSRKIDSGMVAYLACLDQIAQLIMSLNPQVRVPYRIEQDRIGSVSIKMQFGQDDR